MPLHFTKQHAYLWCRINTALASHQQANVYWTSPCHSSPTLKRPDGTEPQTKWRDVKGNASLCQTLHCESKVQTRKIYSLIYPKEDWSLKHALGVWPCHPVSVLKDLHCIKCMLRQWCPLLWCISHPKLLEVRDFVKTLMIRGWCVQTCWWLTASPPSQYHNPGGMAGGEAGVLISLLLTTQMVISVIIKAFQRIHLLLFCCELE